MAGAARGGLRGAAAALSPTSVGGVARSASLMVNYLYSSRGAEGLEETMRVRAPAYAADPGGVLRAAAATLSEG